MGATLYPIDANADKRSDSLREVSIRLEDLQTVLYNTGSNRRSELVRIGESLASWQDVVKKEKMIYETLNFFNFDVRRKTLIAEGWVPTRDIATIQLALRHATVSLRFTLVSSYYSRAICHRRSPALPFRPFFMSFVLIKLRRRSIVSTNSQKDSRPLWTATELQLTRK